jgi:hypothetical protein
LCLWFALGVPLVCLWMLALQDGDTQKEKQI